MIIRNDKGKKIIPYTQTNSMFDIKDSVEPLPFLVLAPNRVDPENPDKSVPIDHLDFLQNLGESIRNMRNNLDSKEKEIEQPKIKIRK